MERADIAIARLGNGLPARGLLLLGLRGVGKTVTLNHFRGIAEEADCQTFYLEAPEGQSLPELLIPELLEVLASVSRVAAARQLAERARAAIALFAKAFKIEIAGFELSVDLEEGGVVSGNLERDLPKLFLEVGKAARAAGQAVVFFIDEIQYVSLSDLAALIVSLHRSAQQSLPILFFGSGLPQIAALAGEAKSYAERLFEYVPLAPLTADAADAAIEEPARRGGLAFLPEALSAIRAATQCYPYFLQEWGKHCWNIADDGPVTSALVDRATALALEQLDAGFFSVRYDRLTPREQAYILAMAELGPGTHAAGEVAAQLKVSPQRAGSVKSSLVQKGMVYSPAHGQTAFTVPLFDEFVLRRVRQAKTF